MIPELVLLLTGALGVGGLAARRWNQRARRAHLAQVQTAWVLAGRRVQYGPAAARAFTYPARSAYGALGLVDGQVIFSGHRAAACDIALPLAAVRWVGLAESRTSRAAWLLVERDDRWQVWAFDLLDTPPADFAEALAQRAGLPVHDLGTAPAVYGPARATYLLQDLYGAWQAEREDELLLAPDRLLFGWRSAVSLDAVRRLDVIRQGRGPRLLRIEYTGDDGAPQVIGFALRATAAWAAAIQARRAAPLVIYTGRKAKEQQ